MHPYIIIIVQILLIDHQWKTVVSTIVFQKGHGSSVSTLDSGAVLNTMNYKIIAITNFKYSSRQAQYIYSSWLL